MNMVYKEIIICDICRKELKRRTPTCLEIWLDKDVSKKLGLEPFAYRRRHLFGRGRFGLTTLDICSKTCLVELLTRIKKAMDDVVMGGE